MRFGNVNEGEPEDFVEKAKWLVREHYEGDDPLQEHEVYVVWFAYTLGNWKALVSTMRPDDRYYEVTHKRENDGSDGPATTFIDTYVKIKNVRVDD